jgi:hypothetical protein
MKNVVSKKRNFKKSSQSIESYFCYLYKVNIILYREDEDEPQGKNVYDGPHDYRRE